MHERLAPCMPNLGNHIMSDNDNAAGTTNTKATAARHANRRRWLAAAFATSFAAVSVIAYAAGSDAHHGAGMHGDAYAQVNVTHLHAIVHHVMERATPEQKAKIDGLIATAKPELESLDQQAMAAHRETVELLLQDRIDRSAVADAQAREIEASDRLAKRIDQALTDLSELMTPEQRAQLRAHVKAHTG